MLLIYIIVGDPVSFLAMFGFMVLICSVSAVIEAKKLDAAFLVEFKFSLYALSFSVLTSLVFAVVLARIMFHEAFWSLFAIQYAYLLPVLLVFMMTTFVVYALMKKDSSKLVRQIKLSLAFALVLSLVGSVALLFFMQGLVGKMWDGPSGPHGKARYDMNMAAFENTSLEMGAVGLPVVDALKEDFDAALDEAYSDKVAFEQEWSSKGLCVRQDCFGLLMDFLARTADVMNRLRRGARLYEEAADELEYLRSGEMLAQQESPDFYLAFLKYAVDVNAVEVKGYVQCNLTEEDEAMLRLIQSDFRYGDTETIHDFFGFDDAYSVFVTGLDRSHYLFPASNQSIIDATIAYVFGHSVVAKDLVRFYGTMAFYAKKNLCHSSCRRIYDDRQIEESQESKIVRYKLISGCITEQMRYYPGSEESAKQ